MGDLERANAELQTHDDPLARWLRSLDQTPRVLVVVHPDGYVEAFGLGAKVKLLELYADQSEQTAYENLPRLWREVWYPRLCKGNAYPRKGTYRDMKLVQATIRECCEAAKQGATLAHMPALDSLAGVLEADIPSVMRAVAQLWEEGLIP